MKEERAKSVKDNWSSIKVELKERYPQLTEGDLKYIDGYEDELFKNLQIKTGKNRQELLAEINVIMEENG